MGKAAPENPLKALPLSRGFLGFSEGFRLLHPMIEACVSYGKAVCYRAKLVVEKSFAAGSYW
jgi:hypothetical protein